MADAAAPARPLSLGDFAEMPVTMLKGVGEKRAKAFEQLGVTTLLDLLHHYPRRYIDRSHEATIKDLAVGEEGGARAGSSRCAAGGKRTMSPRWCACSGSPTCTFFNSRREATGPGTGRVLRCFGSSATAVVTPWSTSSVTDRQIIPVYPQSRSEAEYVDIGSAVASAPPFLGAVSSRPAPRVRQRFRFIDRRTAFTGIHEPVDGAGKSAAAPASTSSCACSSACAARAGLPTRGSRTSSKVPGSASAPLPPAHGRNAGAIAEIDADLRPWPMHRLLRATSAARRSCAVRCSWRQSSPGRYGSRPGCEQPPSASVRPLGGHRHHDAILMGERRVGQAHQPYDTGRARLLLIWARATDLVWQHHIRKASSSHARRGRHRRQHRFGVEQRAALREKSAGTPFRRS
jgi:ATP-dependent DNA helicase RecG